jgi:hypothetical protein
MVERNLKVSKIGWESGHQEFGITGADFQVLKKWQGREWGGVRSITHNTKMHKGGRKQWEGNESVRGE